MLLVAKGTLLGTRTLLGAPGLTTRSKDAISKKGISTRGFLLGAPGLTTRSKDATSSRGHFY